MARKDTHYFNRYDKNLKLIIPIPIPDQRIVFDISRDTVQFTLVSDDMVVIPFLPFEWNVAFVCESCDGTFYAADNRS